MFNENSDFNKTIMIATIKLLNENSMQLSFRKFVILLSFHNDADKATLMGPGSF